MTTRLAFYRGQRSQNPGSMLGDWLICAVTGSQYSHVEMLASHGAAPAGTTVGGVPYTGPMAWMLSSSLRDGGVREARRTLDMGRWVVVEFDGDSSEALAYIRSRIGTPYGWIDLGSFLLPFRVSTDADFCSEVIAAAFGLPDPWHKSPDDLFEWAMAQPGAGIVADDDLLKTWSATNG